MWAALFLGIALGAFFTPIIGTPRLVELIALAAVAAAALAHLTVPQ